MINFKNTAENLGIVIVVMFVTAFVTYKATIASAVKISENTAKSFLPTIEKAIDKETIKNEITNDIALNIEKIKKSDSININVNQEPINDQKPTNNLESSNIAPKCPKGSICFPIENLTRRQKKRLGLD